MYVIYLICYALLHLNNLESSLLFTLKTTGTDGNYHKIDKCGFIFILHMRHALLCVLNYCGGS